MRESRASGQQRGGILKRRNVVVFTRVRDACEGCMTWHLPFATWQKEFSFMHKCLSFVLILFHAKILD